MKLQKSVGPDKFVTFLVTDFSVTFTGNSSTDFSGNVPVGEPPHNVPATTQQTRPPFFPALQPSVASATALADDILANRLSPALEKLPTVLLQAPHCISCLVAHLRRLRRLPDALSILQQGNY